MNTAVSSPESQKPVTREDLLTLKIEMMKMLGGAFAAFSLILGLLGYFGFQQVMKNQLEKWAQDEFKQKIEASIALADSAAKQANTSLAEVNVILAGLKTKAAVPAGTIIPWFPPETPKDGGALNVPKGWTICDGSNGTPNLQDRFILGTVDPKNIGKQGGSKTHNHTASFSASRFEADNIGSKGTGASRHDDTRVSVSEAEAMPPYTMLIYIMKLP